MMWFYVLTLSCSMFCCLQKNESVSDKSNSHIQVHLDSVFINAYEVGQFTYPRYIFYYYKIKNTSNDPIKVNIRRYDYEEVAGSKSFCVFKGDTLELYGGNFTPNKFTLEPKKEHHVDLNPSPDDLLDLFEKYKNNYKTEQDFLRDVAEHSINYFSWDDVMVIDNDINGRKVSFRNAQDSTTQEWK